MIIIQYLYKAANRAGQTVEGVIEATDKKAVVYELRAKSLYLLELSEINPKTSMDVAIGSAKIPKRILAIFCTQFASILKAGVPLVQALSMLEEQTDHKKFKSILTSVYEDLQRGKGLSESFAVHERALPGMMIQMIEAGEVSGTLDRSLERLAVTFDKDYRIMRKVRSAMLYPTIVGILSLLVVVFMLVVIVPQFVNIFESLNTELHWMTKAMLSISDFVVHQWPFLLAGVVALYTIIKMIKSTQQGRLFIDGMKLKVPLTKKAMVRLLSARLSRTLSSLMASGIPLTQSLRIASKIVSNKVAENKLLDIEEQIKQGRTLYAAISAAEIFPSMLTHMAKIGEESGTLDQMLEKAAEYFEEEADVAITRLTTILQPILLVFVALIVIAIILSVLLPMLSMYTSI